MQVKELCDMGNDFSQMLLEKNEIMTIVEFYVLKNVLT